MNPLKIQTTAQGTFLTGKLDPGDSLDKMTVGMLQNNRIKGLIPLTKAQMDNECWLKYDVTSMITVDQYTKDVLSRGKVLNLLSQVAETFLLAEDYMIDASFIVLDYQHLYIHPVTGEIGILCLPLTGFVSPVTLRNFVSKIMRAGRFNSQENCNYVAQILNYVNDREFTAEGFKKLIDQLVSEGVERVQRKAQDAGGSEERRFTGEDDQTAASAEPVSAVSGQSERKRSQVPPVPLTEKPVKEKRRLFGKKKKKDKGGDVGSPSPGGMSVPGIAIPGMEIPGKAVQGRGTAVSSSDIPSEREPQQLSGTAVKQPPKHPLFSGRDKKGKDASAAPSEQELQQLSGAAVGGMDAQLADIAQQINGGSGGKPVWTLSADFENGVEVSDATVVLRQNGMAADQPAPSAALRRLRTGEVMELKKQTTFFGKDPSSVDCYIGENDTISRVHASITARGGQYFIQDNHSMNHTYVDGIRVAGGQERPIRDGCVIQLSDEEFIFECERRK